MKSLETYRADLEQAYFNPEAYITAYFESFEKRLEETFTQVKDDDRDHNYGKMKSKINELKKECLNKAHLLKDLNKILDNNSFADIIRNSQKNDQSRVYLSEELHRIEMKLFLNRSMFFLSNATSYDKKYIPKDPISECKEQSNVKDETLVMIDSEGVNLMGNLPRNSSIRLFCIKDYYLNENSLSVLTGHAHKYQPILSNNDLIIRAIEHQLKRKIMNQKADNITEIALDLRMYERIEFKFFGKYSLTSVEPELFKKFISLLSIDFSNNKLQIIPVDLFKYTNHATEINLSNNCLQEINQDVFNSLKHLKTINLSYNRFKKLSVDTFSKIPNLKELDLVYITDEMAVTDKCLNILSFETKEGLMNEGIMIRYNKHVSSFLRSNKFDVLDDSDKDDSYSISSNTSETEKRTKKKSPKNSNNNSPSKHNNSIKENLNTSGTKSDKVSQTESPKNSNNDSPSIHYNSIKENPNASVTKSDKGLQTESVIISMHETSSYNFCRKIPKRYLIISVVVISIIAIIFIALFFYCFFKK